MGNPLQEQLLKMGLVNDKQVKKAKQEQHKKAKQQGRGGDDEARRAAAEAAAAKAERDRTLNRQRQEEEGRKAAAAQVRQMIEANRLPVDDHGAAYHFDDAGKVKRLHVADEVRRKLASGQAAVVRYRGGYAAVPAEVADKIAARDPAAVVSRAVPTEAAAADDPYAAYQVPDDLVW